MFVVVVIKPNIGESLYQTVCTTPSMDATSRKLIRRAKLRRSHDRHARAVAKSYKKRQGPDNEEKRTARNQYERSDDRQPISFSASRSTIPCLPSLSDSQSLTGSIAGSHKSNNKSSRVFMNGCLSDSYEPSCKEDSGGRVSRGGNMSDSAVVCSRQPPPAQTEKTRRLQRTKRTTQQSDSDVISEEPTLALSPMLRQKTGNLHLPDETLQEIKEMSGRLKIVNWLLDSGTVPLCTDNSKVSTKPKSTYTTTSSGNLVVVRRNSSNWFDAPRFVTRDFSPVSLNSELKSDVEEELSNLT